MESLYERGVLYLAGGESDENKFFFVFFFCV